MAGKSSAWVGGAAIGAVVIAAGAWFGAIQPTMVSAADQRQEAADQRDHNDMLDMQLTTLKAQYEHLDEYKAQLADIRVKVPTTGDLAQLTLEVKAAAESAGVTVTNVAPGTAVSFVAPAPAAAEPAPTETPAADDAAATDTGEEAAAPASGATAPVDGLFQISFSVTSVGSYPQTVAFLNALQRSMPRLFVVNQLTATSLESGGAAGGRPAVNDGDLEAVITGYVLTLQDDRTAAPEPDPTATPQPLPVPGDQRNPFLPVGG